MCISVATKSLSKTISRGNRVTEAEKREHAKASIEYEKKMLSNKKKLIIHWNAD